MPPFDLIWTLVVMAVVLGVVLNAIAYAILLERWIAAWVQDRLGPNRVGPWGLLQPIADGGKMFLKEDIVPDHVDKVFFIAAPGIACATALLAFCVVPFGPTVPPPDPVPVVRAEGQSIDDARAEALAKCKSDQAYYEDESRKGNRLVVAPGIDIGVMFAFAVTSLAVYGIILGGWSSNDKYSLLGALRSSAQLISYEIPLGTSIIGIVLFSGSMNMERIVQDQYANGWNIIYQPLAFVIFLTGAFAECNRLPFDLPEAEQELVGGYHTEYSSMKFGLFFLGEYAHMITTSFMLSVLFLGGWHLPYVTETGGYVGMGIKLLVIQAKAFFFICFYMIVRWTIPRFRFDQLMGLAWQTLIPLTLVYLVCCLFVREFELSRWWLLAASALLFVGLGLLELRTINKPVPRPVRRSIPRAVEEAALAAAR